VSSVYVLTGWRISHNWLNWSQSKSHIATDGQSVLLSSPICQLLFCPCGAPSVTKGRVRRVSESLSAVITQSSQCTLCLHFTFYYMLLNVCVYIQYIQSLLSFQGQYSRSCPVFISSHYNGSLVTWTVVCLTAAKFKPLVFPVSVFALSIFIILTKLVPRITPWHGQHRKRRSYIAV
jgi:hypothetical protein